MAGEPHGIAVLINYDKLEQQDREQARLYSQADAVVQGCMTVHGWIKRDQPTSLPAFLALKVQCRKLRTALLHSRWRAALNTLPELQVQLDNIIVVLNGSYTGFTKQLAKLIADTRKWAEQKGQS